MLIIVDYFLATSFFIDMATYDSPFLNFVVAWIAPLAITIISMLLMQQTGKNLKKIRSSKDIIDLFRLSTPLLLLLFFFIYIIFIRIYTSDSKMLGMDILFGVLFISLVVVVSHYVEKNGKDVPSLIVVPASILALFIEMIIFSVLWIIENVYIILNPKDKTAIESLSYKKTKDIQNEIRDSERKKQKGEYLLKQLTDNILRIKEKYAGTEKDRLLSKIDNIDADILNTKKVINEINRTVNIFKKDIADIYEGCNDGAMKVLIKRNKTTNYD
jgi:hypothetical protein